MINIMFGGNYKVCAGILQCILSMIKYCNKPITVYILTADVSELNTNFKPITQNQVNLLDKLIKEKNINNKIKLITLGNDFNDWVKMSSNKKSYYTPFAFLRLFADKIKLPNKILYLDTDIMINGNIENLYNIDISNKELGVVLDRYGHFFIKPFYFNSGMLLMNMKKLKETQLLARVRNMCIKRKMAFPDQSALNKFCKEKIYLPRKFNEQGKLKHDTIIHHFSKKIKWLPFFHTTNIKPWQIDDVRNKYHCHAYDDIYKDFLQIKATHQI